MTKSQLRGYQERLAPLRYQPSQWLTSPGKKGIEIGFGMGQALAQWASEAPDWNLLGIELYKPGVGSLADKLVSAETSNVQIAETPAQKVFAEFPDGCIDEIRILFPDPWPKKRHAKRRLIQPDFVAELARALTTHGVLRLATDWAPYAEWMKEVLAQEPRLRIEVDRIRAPDEVGERQQATKFESRGEKLGHDIYDLVLVRQEVRDH